MPVGAVKVIGQVRAALATFFPSRGEHEMINDQLAAILKKIGQRFFTIGSIEIYSLSTLTHGSSRRWRLTSSRSRVSSFSRVSKSFRATSHSASGTTLGFASLLFVSGSNVSIFILSCFVCLMISVGFRNEILNGYHHLCVNSIKVRTRLEHNVGEQYRLAGFGFDSARKWLSHFDVQIVAGTLSEFDGAVLSPDFAGFLRPAAIVVHVLLWKRDDNSINIMSHGYSLVALT